MKFLKKKKTLEEWQKNMKTCFDLLFCESVSSAAAKKQLRFVTAFNLMEEFWKTIILGKIIFLKYLHASRLKLLPW